MNQYQKELHDAREFTQMLVKTPKVCLVGHIRYLRRQVVALEKELHELKGDIK